MNGSACFAVFSEGLTAQRFQMRSGLFPRSCLPLPFRIAHPIKFPFKGDTENRPHGLGQKRVFHDFSLPKRNVPVIVCSLIGVSFC